MDIAQAISSFGFPIVACCGMGWFCYVTMTGVKESLDSLSSNISVMTKCMEQLEQTVYRAHEMEVEKK